MIVLLSQLYKLTQTFIIANSERKRVIKRCKTLNVIPLVFYKTDGGRALQPPKSVTISHTIAMPLIEKGLLSYLLSFRIFITISLLYPKWHLIQLWPVQRGTMWPEQTEAKHRLSGSFFFLFLFLL